MLIDSEILVKYVELMHQASDTINNVIESLNQLKNKLEEIWK